MKQRRYNRPARWGLAVGLPGMPPSREAVQLAASPRLTLPAGCWHVSDYTADLLARCTPAVSSAVHHETGARFRLASIPDGPVVAICAEDAAARELAPAFWPDPAGWANRQRWTIAGAA
jgi:hypothetical protein